MSSTGYKQAAPSAGQVEQKVVQFDNRRRRSTSKVGTLIKGAMRLGKANRAQGTINEVKIGLFAQEIADLQELRKFIHGKLAPEQGAPKDPKVISTYARLMVSLHRETIGAIKSMPQYDIDPKPVKQQELPTPKGTIPVARPNSGRVIDIEPHT